MVFIETIIIPINFNSYNYYFIWVKNIIFNKLYGLIIVDIIHDLVKRRLDAYDEVTEVKNIEKPVKLFEEIESVTSSPYDPKIEADNRTTDS